MTVTNGDILKAAMELVFVDSSIMQNVYYFKAVFSDDQTDAAVLAAINTYLDDIYTAIDDYVKSNVTINPCEVSEVEWNAGESKWLTSRVLGTTTPVVTFTDALEGLPRQCAAVMLANTLRPKTRGRKFFGGLCEDDQVGSYWVSSFLTALGVALNHYLADETVSGTNVLSPGVASTLAGVFYDFTDGVVNDIVGTQRRRTPGVGA